jgi:hypothetical protein
VQVGAAARACEAVAVGHRHTQARAALEVHTRTTRGVDVDEVVHRARIEQGRQRHRTHLNSELHCARGARLDAGECVKRDGRIR